MLRHLAIVLVVAAAGQASATVVTWSTGSGGNGHSYEAVAVTANVSWFDARTMAEALGGTLATITSQAENDFVYDNLASDPSLWRTGGQGPWLGGLLVAGSWTWITGETWGYTNWGFGNPSGGAEQCLQFYNGAPGAIPSPFWNDHQGFAGGASGPDIPASFIVEYVPSPGSAAVLIGAIVTTSMRRKRSVDGAALAM